MTSHAHKYEDFGDQSTFLDDKVSQDGRDVDGEKLQSFDDGYQAGWEDSAKAQSNSIKKISSDFVKNLQDVSFSYHEARSALTQALRPLFQEISNKLLPEIARSSIGAHIVEQLSYMARNKSDQAIEVVVSPTDFEPINRWLGEQISDPFILIAQSDLGEGQVYLRLGSQEREINFGQLIQEIRNSTHSLFETEQVDG